MNIEQILQSLGKNEANILFSLRYENIKGERKSMAMCPIALYLKKFQFQHVLVDSKTLTHFTNEYEIKALPLPIQQWIKAFDNGAFPEFERKNWFLSIIQKLMRRL